MLTQQGYIKSIQTTVEWGFHNIAGHLFCPVHSCPNVRHNVFENHSSGTRHLDGDLEKIDDLMYFFLIHSMKMLFCILFSQVAMRFT